MSGEYPAENTGTGWCGCRGIAAADGRRDEMLYRLGAIEKLQAAVMERRKSLSENRLASEQITKKLDTAMREVKELTTEREEINRLLPGLEEAWQLASSRSAEHMRAALKPGEPCPVCGAREHPYAEGIAEVLQPVKEEIARRRKRLTEIEERLDASPGGLRLLCSELNGKLSALREGTGRLNAELAEAVGEWTTLVVAYPALPADVVRADAPALSALLTAESERIVVQGKQVRAEQNAYQQAQNELTAMRRTYDENQVVCARQREELHRRTVELKQRQGQSEQKRAELQQLERANSDCVRHCGRKFRYPIGSRLSNRISGSWQTVVGYVRQVSGGNSCAAGIGGFAERAESRFRGVGETVGRVSGSHEGKQGRDCRGCTGL